jgi:hypothetical protein
MKTKVKKYAKGMLTDSSGNPVRSSSGEPVRTRSDEEFAEDSKFGGYGRYMPKGGSLTRGIKETSRPSEDLAPYEPESPFLNKGTGTDITNKPESVKPIVDASQAPAAADDTYAYNKKYTTVKPENKKPKSKVSKADLEKSGLSLRDYMNKERGLTRREPKFDKFKQTELKSGGKVSSASSRGDGIAQRGKTRGKMC